VGVSLKTVLQDRLFIEREYTIHRKEIFMHSHTLINNTHDTAVPRLSEEISNADAIVIGAGAGLSSSAGFFYNGERFKKNFSDFEEKYNFHDMYSGGFYPYPTLEERWAFWSRNIMINRYEDALKPVYNDLYSLIQDKDYFVITTNVDHCFQKAGFDKKKLFYTQGDYGLFQCIIPCHQKTYNNEAIVRKMVEQQKDMLVPTELLPNCPVCGKPMTMNLRIDNRFVEDDGWHRAAERYELFLRSHENIHILFLELGVGYNSPGIIKYPFWNMTANNINAVYACVNSGEAECPQEIEKRSICIDNDIGAVLKELTLSNSIV
jgi:NAD-dependent SIR2 family protein deacetylase